MNFVITKKETSLSVLADEVFKIKGGKATAASKPRRQL